MYSYNLLQWVLFFYVYSFLGWCFESTYVSIRTKRVVNRGFMRGPFLPLYGSGALLMLLVSAPFQGNIFLTYIAGCIGATVLEYVTGAWMEALFKVRYWDYSKVKFNLNGYICLSSSIAWGFFTLLLTKFLHRPVELLVTKIPYTALTLVVFILTVFIAGDIALSFKAAFDIRDILIATEKAKEEVEHLRKRLDVVLAVANDTKDEVILEIEERFREIKDSRIQIKGIKDFYKRNMILGNPTMISAKFKESMEEIKEFLDDRRKKK